MEEEKSLLKKMAEMFSDDDDEENVSEEIMALARVAKEQQKLSAAEVERLRNILMFCEKDVKDAMSHRKDIVGIDEETILEDAIRFMLKERYSRFPIYEEDIDNIKGILHIRDAMRMYLIPGCQRRFKGAWSLHSEGEFRAGDAQCRKNDVPDAEGENAYGSCT